MKFKKGVDLNGIQAEMLDALPTIERVWRRHGREAWITSGRDGKHRKGSRHYVGLAVDVRHHWWEMPVREAVAEELAAMLGPRFDVVLEKTHIHVEYDPKEIER